MDKERVIESLSARFPGRKIVRLPEDKPTEIICEIEPTEDHPDYSVAVAVIDQSEPHLHNDSTETYKILGGEVTLFLGVAPVKLRAGDVFQIPPGTVHWATGNSSVVRVRSDPGWRPSDHILVPK